MITARDKVWLKKALALGRRGVGRTRPNPPVGALVVKGNRLLGSGYHRKAGTPHAEIHALRAAGGAARGGTLYVTLEPCSTRGRTGPCTSAIRAAGIRRVVCCIQDPNPVHRGRGLAILRRAGVAVSCGGLEAEASALLAPFAKWIVTRLPLVTLKLGMTADGRIADDAGNSQWITSAVSRRRVQALRAEADVVLIGSRTAVADDPALTCRSHPGQPLMRVIMDSTGKLPLSAQVLNDAHAERTIVATTERCPQVRRRAYSTKGAQVWLLAATAQGRVSPKALLTRLGREGYLHVLCEGGGELAGALLDAQLVDRMLLFVAPKLLGGGSRPAVGGRGWRLARAPELEFERVERLGPDLLLVARPIQRGPGRGK